VSKQQELKIEVLSGPLDGHTVSLQADTDWTGTGSGPLAFPWDDELGEPQARFTLDDQGWGVEGRKSPHGTYHMNREEKVRDRIRLESGDVLKASRTWLLIQSID
jgi:hypothetical protein